MPHRRRRSQLPPSTASFIFGLALSFFSAAALLAGGSSSDEYSGPDDNSPSWNPRAGGISPLTAQIALAPQPASSASSNLFGIPPQCQAYANLLSQKRSSLSQRLMDKGPDSFMSGSLAPFLRDSELEVKRSAIRWIETLPEVCRGGLRRMLGYTPRVRVVAWTQMGESLDPYSTSSAEPRRLLGAYRNLIAEQTGFCPKVSENLEDLSPEEQKTIKNCLSKFADPLYGYARKQISQDPKNLLGELAAAGMPDMSLDDARLISAFDAILNASGSDALAYAKAHGPELNDEQWITVAQMLGSKFREGYDDERNNAGVSAQGVVTLDDLLKTGRENEARRFYGDDEAASYLDAKWAGVCRDIASAQGQILEATGRFSNVFVVSFSTIAGTFHVTTLAQGKEDLNRVYRLDYGARHDAQSGDSRALFNGPRDVSIVYRVSRPGGRVVGNVQSEFGNFLNRAAGGDLRAIDPLARARGSIVGAELDLSGRGSSLVRIGLGEDGLNQRYAFVGFTQTWGASGNFPGRAAIVLGAQKRPDSLSNDKAVEGSQIVFFYTEVEQHFTATKELVKGVRLTTDTSASIAGMLGLSVEAQKPLKDGIARLKQEVILVHDVSDSTAVVYRTGVVISPGIADIRDNSIQMLTPAIDTIYGSFEVRHVHGSVSYSSQATVAGSDAFGARGRLQVGASTHKVGGVLGVEGRLNSSAAPFLDGWRRRIFALAQFKPIPQLQLTIEANLYEREKRLPGAGASFGIIGEW